MMKGTKRATLGVILAVSTLAALQGLALPASPSSLVGYPQIRIPRPIVTLRQCQRAAGCVEAQTRLKAVCTGGIYSGAPVGGE
jgi:hypothetical protein